MCYYGSRLFYDLCWQRVVMFIGSLVGFKQYYYNKLHVHYDPVLDYASLICPAAQKGIDSNSKTLGIKNSCHCLYGGPYSPRCQPETVGLLSTAMGPNLAKLPTTERVADVGPTCTVERCYNLPWSFKNLYSVFRWVLSNTSLKVSVFVFMCLHFVF